jgi:hypothetical protein
MEDWMSEGTTTPPNDRGYKVIFMHGFTQDEVGRILRGVKSVVEDPGKVAFCMSTDNNVDWKIRDLIDDVTEEHDFMKKNRPGNGSDGGGDPGAPAE